MRGANKHSKRVPACIRLNMRDLLPEIPSGRDTDMPSLRLFGAQFGVRRQPLIPTKPFQYPSIGHLDERVAKIVEYERTVEGLREHTLEWALRSYRSFRRFLIASHEESAFLSGDLERQLRVVSGWVAWLRLNDLSRVAINSYWRGVLSLFRWIGVQDGSVNPFAFLTSPRIGRINPRCLTKASAEGVLEYVRNASWKSKLVRSRNLLIVGLMLLAGLRRGEVLRLRCGDVDLEEGTIRIVAGKGPHGGKDRTCYMPPQLREMLATYLRERHRAGRTHPELLTSAEANRGVSAEPIRRVCDLAGKALHMRVTPHMLRHTYATLLRQAGVPDRVSMDLLGHTSLAMLQRYSHVFSGEHLREASRLRLDVEL